MQAGRNSVTRCDVTGYGVSVSQNPQCEPWIAPALSPREIFPLSTHHYCKSGLPFFFSLFLLFSQVGFPHFSLPGRGRSALLFFSFCLSLEVPSCQVFGIPAFSSSPFAAIYMRRSLSDLWALAPGCLIGLAVLRSVSTPQMMGSSSVLFSPIRITSNWIRLLSDTSSLDSKRNRRGTGVLDDK